MEYFLILGAKSDMAKAVAIKYVKEGYNLYLAARNSEELKNFAKDLQIRYSKNVICIELDILNYNSHKPIYDSIRKKPIGVISFIGFLGDQKNAQNDFQESTKIINTNFTGLVSILNIVANDFEKNKKGFIVGVSSVAGDRGRQSNYIYGSSKAAFSAYLSGLRNRLSKSNVHVLTVKPGFVDTRMTKDMNLPKILTANPKEVAKDIYRAQQRKKNVLYTKWFWKWIMAVVKNIPEFQFKKMKL